MMDLKTLGAMIASRRSGMKLTQAALAERARIGHSTLDALENGRLAELGFGKICRLLAALGLDIKIVEANQGRPTLEDLLSENDD